MLHLHAEKPRSLALVPVIARVPLLKRVFPHGRIVFEPREVSEATLGEKGFERGELELRFPRGGAVVRMGSGVEGRAKKVHQYWRITVGPVFVFLKKGKLHCVSVPVEYLRGKLRGW
jgi:hypothetical protein